MGRRLPAENENSGKSRIWSGQPCLAFLRAGQTVVLGGAIVAEVEAARG